MTWQAIVRAGNFAFQCRTRGNRFVVTDVAVVVIGDLVRQCCGRRFVREGDAGNLYAVIARLRVTSAAGLDWFCIRRRQQGRRKGYVTLGGR